MSEGGMAFGAILLVVGLWFMFYGMAADDTALAVPDCDDRAPGFLQLESESDEQSFATMVRLAEKGWTDITRTEHFWTDTLTAQCEPSGSEGGA